MQELHIKNIFKVDYQDNIIAQISPNTTKPITYPSIQIELSTTHPHSYIITRIGSLDKIIETLPASSHAIMLEPLFKQNTTTTIFMNILLAFIENGYTPMCLDPYISAVLTESVSEEIITTTKTQINELINSIISNNT